MRPNHARPLLILMPAILLARAGEVVAQTPTAPDVRAVAELDGQAIRVADLQAKLSAQRRQDLAAGRIGSFAPSAKEATLRGMVDVKRLSIAARERGIDQRPDIRQQIETAVEELLAQAVVADITAKVAVGEEERRRYYDAHPEEFQVPGRVRARHIVVKTEAEAVSLLGRLKRNGDFARLAREHNVDSTKAAGGELGWVSRGVMVAPFERALLSLRVGELSPIVQTSYGFHVIQVEEIEPSKSRPFASLGPEIKQKLVDREVAAFKEQLARKHPVRVHDDVLKSVR